jgi:hypothetical protein
MIRPDIRPPGSPPTLAEYKALMADRDRPLTDLHMTSRRMVSNDTGTEDAYTGTTKPDA